MNKPRYLLFGNAESVHMLKWAKELVKHYDVFILSPLGVHTDILKIIPETNIVTLNLKLNPDGGNVALLKKLFLFKRLIKQINPAIVNAHYITSHGFIAAIIKSLLGVNYVLVQSAWGTDILVTPNRSFLYKFITKYSLNKANVITSDSEYMSDVIKKLSKTKCITFPFGLDYLPEVKIEEKDINLCFSNRALTENYNIDNVIYAFATMVFKNEKLKLIIANDGSMRNELIEITKNIGLSDRIEFKGFLSASQQIEIYKKSTYYFSLPTSDSTSVSLLEAMAYGCIPILSDLPANREWVVNGKNGVIFTTKEDFINHIPDKLKAFNENRIIISKRAIFCDSILKFVEVVMSELQ
ncbi:MAG: glycosyltransferase [Bacteroidia bacterium]|nr:glycosyltransferase [Bacteroidia bacterium]